MEQDVTYQLDLRGMNVPITLLKLMQGFRRLNPGETLEILGNDAQTRKDLFKVLQALRYELISLQNDMTFYRVRLRKRH